jgi:putative membrane protein
MNLLLATLGTLLVASSVYFLVTGRAAIRRGEVDSHRRRMLVACALQAAFVVVFLLRLARFGLTPFGGEDVVRAIYLAVLVSHEGIAVVTAPLVMVALALALRGRILEHRQVAQVAWPIWLYASVTGTVVYAFLYVLP